MAPGSSLNVDLTFRTDIVILRPRRPRGERLGDVRQRELLPRPGTTEWRSVAPGTYTLQLLGERENVVDSIRVELSAASRAPFDYERAGPKAPR